jgi:hypothetical protein
MVVFAGSAGEETRWRPSCGAWLRQLATLKATSTGKGTTPMGAHN